jgi:hypothetical protein
VAWSHWIRVFDTVGNLAQLSGRFRRTEPGPLDAPLASGGGVLGQLETRLAGVVVAALKEAFDRDRARMDLERQQFEAERQRAEDALRAELRRQAADRALSQVKLIAVMAVGVWMLSAALAVWMPGMRAGIGRALLGGGWFFALAALAGAFIGWRRIAEWTAVHVDLSGSASSESSVAENVAPWLLICAIALCGAALLVAL